MQTFLHDIICENSGKKKRALQRCCGLGKATDRVLTNQFGINKRRSKTVANNEEIMIRSFSESIKTSKL